MINKKFIAAASTIALALPSVLLAFNAGPIPNAVPGLNISTLVDILFAILWPVFVAFAIVMFIIAAFYFFTAQGDPESVKVARNFVIFGAVGVVVALVAFSIPFILRNTLGQGI